MTVATRRVAFVVVLLLLGALRWFDVHPLELQASDREQAGWPLTDGSPADVLLLVDPDVVHEAGRGKRFDWADWSYGWVNLLEQEIGRFAVMGPGEVRLGALDGRRVVVVSRSAARAAELWISHFQSYVEEGGVLVLERPSTGWSTLSGVRMEGSEGRIRSLQRRPERLAADVEADLVAMPWFTKPLYLVPTGVVPTEVVLEANGRAIAVVRRLGDGMLVTPGLDVGRQVTAIQQGLPDEGSFQVTNRYEDVLNAPLESNDLVSDRRLLVSTVPYADVFERVIASLLDLHGPLPRWWLFPDAKPGAYLASHDEEGMGDKAAWMAEAERAWGVRSTWFLVPSERFTDQGLAALGVGAKGLHYHAGESGGGPQHELGVWRVNPARRPWSLEEQAGWFEELVGVPPRLNRNHYLLWDKSWAAPFRKMAAAGIRFDSTYGPDVKVRGYLFGTALPFMALDENGLPLPVRELPFQVAEDLGGADREFLFGLLRSSAERYHQAVGALFHPNVFRWRPRTSIYQLWRDAFEEARRLDLWITDLGEVLTVMESRRSAVLTSSFANGLLRTQAAAAFDGMTIALPARWRDRPAGPITVDGAPSAALPLASAATDLLLVPLRAGHHTVIVDYPALRTPPPGGTP